MSLHSLAGVLKAQGDLSGAREKLERSLQIQASVFGTEAHPSVAASLHSLAGVLQAQGDLSGAREKYERVLEIEEKVYGTREHYSTAITERNLGFLLLELEEGEAGAALLVHAFQVFRSQLGAEHPYTKRLASLFEKGRVRIQTVDRSQGFAFPRDEEGTVTGRVLLRSTPGVARTAQLRSKGQCGFELRPRPALHVS